MAKFHINPETGKAGECRAKKRCKFSGATDHYESIEAANEAIEAREESYSAWFRPVSKKDLDLIDKVDEEIRASGLSSLKTEEGRRESVIARSLYDSTDWADEDSVESYYTRLSGRREQHERMEEEARSRGEWRKAKAHAGVVQALKKP